MTLLLTLALTVLTHLPQEDCIRIPQTLTDPTGYTFWVAEDQARTETGWREELFEERNLGVLRRTARKNAAAGREHGEQDQVCSYYLPSKFEHFRRTDSLRNLTANASLIVTGGVGDAQQGFLFGRPGTLYRLANIAVLKGELKASQVFLFFPYAIINTPDGVICGAPSARPAPGEGDEIIAFSIVGAKSVGDVSVLLVNAESELAFGTASRVVLPKTWATAELPESARTLTGIEDRVRHLLESEDGRD